MSNSNRLPLLALAALLVIQVAICSGDELAKAIEHERDGLDYDKRMFNDLRARYIVGQTQCKDRRSRRAAYKLIRELELERAQAIETFLRRNVKSLTLDEFYDELGRIQSSFLDKIEPVERLMEAACSYPEGAKRFAQEAGLILRRFLESRLPGRDMEKSRREFTYPNGDQLADGWDENEVDLESDREGATAVSEAVKNEREALRDDWVQIKRMGRFPDCGRVDITVFGQWAKTREAEIKRVLAREFFSPKELRRELAKVHAQQLAKLDSLDGQLQQRCHANSYKTMIHWMDTNFFERQLAVIKGNDWMGNKANGFRGRTIDFAEMKLFEMQL